MKSTEMTLDDRIQLLIVRLLRSSLIVAAVWLGFQREWELMAISILAFVLTSTPIWLEKYFKVTFPVEFTFIIVVFMYASAFLGEVGGAYERFWWWDMLLHVSSAVVLGFAGFLLLIGLYSRHKVKASAMVMAVFAFCFALAAGALWEIFEFGVDQLFGTNMQKSGLVDTMADLMVDAAGGIFVAVLAYGYIKNGDKNFFGRLVEEFLRRNPRLRKS